MVYNKDDEVDQNVLFLMPMFTVYDHQIKVLEDGGKIDVFTIEQETYHTQFLNEEKLT